MILKKLSAVFFLGAILNVFSPVASMATGPDCTANGAGGSVTNCGNDSSGSITSTNTGGSVTGSGNSAVGNVTGNSGIIQGGTGIGGAGGNATIEEGAIKNSNKQSQLQGQQQQIKNSGNSTNDNRSSASSSSTSGATSGQSQGNSNTIQGDSVKVFAPAPDSFAPALTAVPETCMGSTSAGASGGNGVFGFGISFGTTWKSSDCELRMYARALQSLGQTQAALALISQNENVAKALKAAGVAIPGAQADVVIPPAPVQSSRLSTSEEIVPVSVMVPEIRPGILEQSK